MLLLKSLNLKTHETETLRKAEAWCRENVPESLHDLEGDSEIIDDFSTALGLPKIPDKKLRSRLAATNGTPADALARRASV